MMGDIRRYAMHRMCSLRFKCIVWERFDVCPNIRLAINELKIHLRFVQFVTLLYINDVFHTICVYVLGIGKCFLVD